MLFFIVAWMASFSAQASPAAKDVAEERQEYAAIIASAMGGEFRGEISVDESGRIIVYDTGEEHDEAIWRTYKKDRYGDVNKALSCMEVIELTWIIMKDWSAIRASLVQALCSVHWNDLIEKEYGKDVQSITIAQRTKIAGKLAWRFLRFLSTDTTNKVQNLWNSFKEAEFEDKDKILTVRERVQILTAMITYVISRVVNSGISTGKSVCFGVKDGFTEGFSRLHGLVAGDTSSCKQPNNFMFGGFGEKQNNSGSEVSPVTCLLGNDGMSCFPST